MTAAEDESNGATEAPRSLRSGQRQIELLLRLELRAAVASSGTGRSVPRERLTEDPRDRPQGLRGSRPAATH